MTGDMWWIWLLALAVGIALFYYLTRLAVRHGMQDVKRIELEDADRAAVKAARSASARHEDADGL